ncbi:MAG TPA: aldo/keto reductase [Actinomycetota bacterium]|nr:aldo/keto reductase [Actinomycetota bacterium]
MPDVVGLGRSGLKVTRLCLGAMNFGNEAWGCDEPTSAKIIDAFLERGFNFIDTANTYAGGKSEEIVGRAIGARRDEVVLATKGFSPEGTGPNDWGNSRANLTRSLEASLRRLGTDYVDLYQVHNWDWTTPIEETMAALDGFVRSGKVRYIGCSNWQGSQIVEGQWAASRIGGAPLVSLQPQYSLIVRDIERDILPTARRHGLGAIVWSPLGGGVLSGKYTRDDIPDDSRFGKAQSGDVWDRFRQTLFSERNFEIVDKVGEVAAKLGSNHAAVAVAWTINQPGVTSAIIGLRTVEQLEDNLAADELSLDADTLKELDRSARGQWAYPNYMQPEPRS